MSSADLKKFEILFKSLRPSLVHFSIYIIGSKHDANEIVNDVFVSVWEKRKKLSLDESLKSYLFQAVKNRSINHQKKKRSIQVPLLDTDKQSSYTADGSLLDNEQQQLLVSILDSLPPKCRQVFVLSRMDHLSYSQIAGLMDISVKTVEAQMSKALKIFRKKINRE